MKPGTSTFTLRTPLLLGEPGDVVADGCVVVSGDRVAYAGQWAPHHGDGPVTDLPETFITPGLVNAHTHLHLTYLAGRVPRPRSFTSWLIEMAPRVCLASASLNRQSLRRGVAASLAAGVTTVADVLSRWDVAPEHERTAVRKVVFLELFGLDPEKVPDVIGKAEGTLARLRANGTLTPALAPHAPDAPSLEESTMKVSFGLRNSTVLLLLTLIAASGLLPGCLDNLCTKRLYLYRDAEPKSLPPADMALLIADPAIVAALLPEAASKVTRGLPWAPEQPAYASDFYQLSIDGLDGRSVYQGLCMNITPTYVCEVRPGSRQVMASLKLVGPWGRQSVKDNAALTLEPGGVYFLHPDWEAASNKILRLQTERLPVSYNAALRSKLMDWLRHNTQGRSLEN